MNSPSVAIAITVFTAFVLSAGLTLALARVGVMLDHPNARSLHASPVPRTGGLAVLAAAFTAFALSFLFVAPSAERAWIGAAVSLVAAVSFLYDRKEVQARYRLAAHLLAALLLVTGGMAWARFELPNLAWTMPHWLSLVLTLLFVVWMINLYNFMDGMDGFAAGMAVFGFSALAVIGWREQAGVYALGNAVVAASAAGFLLGNFPPARIFLGDLGSATLGFSAAASALVGAREGLFPLWVAWLAFSPFIVDATWTLLRRLVRGERVWEAHRSHHYQRLVLAGWSHRKTLLWSYLLMAACAATSVAAVGMTGQDQALLLAAWTIIYLLIGFRVRLAERTAGSVSA
jgi:UDP-N-acetylmuramyl pentapeptide phosphotransferase/UDP-N-acetylglucosamine-1-phosphate transferase